MKRTGLQHRISIEFLNKRGLLNNRLSLRLLSNCKFSLKIVVFTCDIDYGVVLCFWLLKFGPSLG